MHSRMDVQRFRADGLQLLSTNRASRLLPGLVLLLADALGAATIPAGATLELRLKDRVSSELPAGSPISAVLMAPVYLNGQCVISSGVSMEGVTADVKPVDKNDPTVAATLRLQFTRIRDAAGVSSDLAATLVGIDNAREKISDNGLVTGVIASDTYEAQLQKGLEKLNEKYSGFGGILLKAKEALLKPADAAIDFQPGVELALKLTRDLAWTGAAQAPNIRGIEPLAQLTAMVNRQPSRTAAQKPPDPSDLTNIMLLGSANQLQAAFESAGWSGAADLSPDSKWETARAIIENRGYNEAPVSVLMLDGQPPDRVFQKSNNTFASRHHIRIWKRPETFAGKEVWVAAATHDIAITFSQTSKNFTHQIDENIDAERTKVVNDLIFTGMVKGTALVDRPGVGQNLSNATGDQLKTDRRMAVLDLVTP